MNRRNVMIGATLMPAISTAQEPTLSQQFRTIMDQQIAREVALYSTLLDVWAWLDKWNAELPEDARFELRMALGPEPGVRNSK